jgi:hypothetical protein
VILVRVLDNLDTLENLVRLRRGIRVIWVVKQWYSVQLWENRDVVRLSHS